MQFDDEIVIDNAVETITNISAASPARQQGFYPYVNCTNVTAELLRTQMLKNWWIQYTNV